MTTDPPYSSNRLLAAVDSDVAFGMPGLEHVSLAVGDLLHEPGIAIDHVYFPTTAIVSLLCAMENGSLAEIAVVGNEGMVGIALLMGAETTTNRAVTQSAGSAIRLDARAFRDTIARSPDFMRVLLRYTQALITQMAQTAMCNRYHAVDQQLCRWLLNRLDRLEGNELLVTQEQIASTLGVRREGVTEAALKLQRAGAIRYARGRVVVLDRPALEARSCECYAAVKTEYDRLLPPPLER